MSIIAVLYSSITSDPIQEIGQRRLETLLMGFRFEHIMIDGSDPDNKAIREELFEISKQRGKYPQVFIKNGNSYDFKGLWPDIEAWNECEEIPKEYLEANPDIKTISQVFASVKKIPK